MADKTGGDVAAAVEGAADAVKQVSSESAGGFDHQLRSLAALFTALAALVASVGALVKTFDHSVTENSYNTLSQGIQDVVAAQQRNHDDLTALHGYLDGLVRAGALGPPASPGAASGGGAGAVGAVAPTGTSHTNSLPPVPSVHPTSPVWHAPPFDEVLKGVTLKVPYYGDIKTGGPCDQGTHVLTATWNCDSTKQGRVHCQNGVVTEEACPNGCLTRPNGQDDVCR
jgi:hypothetical protein